MRYGHADHMMQLIKLICRNKNNSVMKMMRIKVTYKQ